MAGYIDIHWAVLNGIISSILGYLGCVKFKYVVGFDDTLDVFGIHGFVGIWGTIAVALFIEPDLNHLKIKGVI